MRLTVIILFLLISHTSFGQGNGLYEFIGKNGNRGFIDKFGKIKIQPNFLVVSEFSEGLCFVSKEIIPKGYKWICIDTLGNEVFDIQNNFPETSFSEGFARISSFTEHWFINKSGDKTFCKTWKDGQGNFKNGLAYVSDIKFSNFYAIDSAGNRVGKATYSGPEVNKKLGDINIEEPKDSLIKFKQDSLWGFKNATGKIIIPAKYYSVSFFQNGICAVGTKYQGRREMNDWYYDAIINTKGEIINRLEMHCYMGFQGELIRYYGGGHFSGGIYYLNEKGEKVIPAE